MNTKAKKTKYNRYKHKHCNCPKDYWEIIIVDHDENFNDEARIYYHCAFSGTEWLITDYYDESIIYHRQKQ